MGEVKTQSSGFSGQETEIWTEILAELAGKGIGTEEVLQRSSLIVYVRAPCISSCVLSFACIKQGPMGPDREEALNLLNIL